MANAQPSESPVQTRGALRFAAALSVLASLVACAEAHAGDPYADGLAQAHEAEGQHDPAAAARILEPLVRAYPEDVPVALELAWAHFSAADYPGAEAAYREVLVRAPWSVDGRLGLAWALVREGRCDDARKEAARIAAEPRAAAVEAACPAGAFRSWELSASGAFSLYAGDPTRASAAGALLTASALLPGNLALGVAYRHLHISTTPSGGSDFEQDEAYVHLGYWGSAAGFVLHAALVSDGSGTFGVSKHVGASAHVAVFGDLAFDGSASIYPDFTVGRVAASWTSPALGPLRFMPGVAVQVAGSDTFGNAFATLVAEVSPFTLWLGGKLGEEVRPAYLSQLAVYDIPEHVIGGAWAGAYLRLGDALGLRASYSFDALRVIGPTATTQSAALHTFSLGPVIRF